MKIQKWGSNKDVTFFVIVIISINCDIMIYDSLWYPKNVNTGNIKK